MKKTPQMQPLEGYKTYPSEEMIERARTFAQELSRRRTVRDYSDRPIPRSVIEDCLRAASSAPSGANLQPWHFAVIQDPQLKHQIREAAEEEERTFYHSRAPEEWLDALAHLGTDEHKPFLEIAPCLIAIFAKSYDLDEQGAKKKNYYVQESVGIATGFLIAALHNAGLATLTHTPSPMGFLRTLLQRPSNERPYLLLVVGYPSENAEVPVITKKPLEAVSTFYDEHSTDLDL